MSGSTTGDASFAPGRPSVRADAIVVAAGRSSRMDGTDKLMAELGGRPLLARTLEAIAAAPEVERIVVVSELERTTRLAAESWLPAKVTTVVPGGPRRQDSVHAGFIALDLDGLDGGRVVLVHDGARPLVTPALVSRVAQATAEYGAAIPIAPVVETLKRLDGEVIVGTVDRHGLGTAQTPQGVRRDLLRSAYTAFPADGPETWTDEASLLEAVGTPVRAVPGEADNLKVTVADDLVRAEALLAGARPTRSGIGQDSHPFGPNAPLQLGGITVAGAGRLHGHSDGDVVLHAIADALLGAAALGDLGRLFPADARTPRGVSSIELLSAVRARVDAAGWRVGSVDVTIRGARPRLGARLDDMRDAIAGVLGVAPSAISVKASTGNLDGPDGAGRSISAIAIATIAGS